jgi:hypothetical protein
MERDVNKVIALAKRTQDESLFQKHQLYKKFKAKYQSQLAQAHMNFETFFGVLVSQEFYNEHVFWGKKILDNQRVCNIEDRTHLLYRIVLSFHCLNDYENALEYGKKSLEHDIQTNEYIETQVKRRVLEIIRDASLLFQKKQDAMKYAKEIVKLDVIRCNKKEIENFYLLQSYHNLIELQIVNCDFKSAQKTINKHLSFVDLNSTDPNEVLVSLEKRDYGKILLWNHLLLEPYKITGSEGSKIAENPKILHNRLFEDHEIDGNEWFDYFCPDMNTLEALTMNEELDAEDVMPFTHWYKMVYLYHFIGKICWQKYEIYLHFGLEENIFIWANMALKILDDILYHIQILKQHMSDSDINASFQVVRMGFNKIRPVRSSDELTVKSFILDKISTTLLLADYDHKNRESLFSQLSKLFLFTDTEDTDAGSTDTENTNTEHADTNDADSEKSDAEDTDCVALIDKSKVSWYIAESLRTNDKLDVPKVMPFIQFCLKSLDGSVSYNEGANSDNNVDIKVQLMTLKNSLSIMNLFKTM